MYGEYPDKVRINKIKSAFEEINSIYIADGHHRAASAVKGRIKTKKRESELRRYRRVQLFSVRIISHDQLMIMP